MKYQVTQKFMALGGDYTAKNEAGKEAFYFDGKVFSFGGRKVIVLDSTKRETARIKKKLFTFRAAYRITRRGRLVAVVRRRSFTVRDHFIIDVPGTGDYEVVGDLIGHEYTIKRGRNDVARISKKFFGATDSYGVDIKGGDELLLLSAVVVIDMEIFKKRKSV